CAHLHARRPRRLERLRVLQGLQALPRCLQARPDTPAGGGHEHAEQADVHLRLVVLVALLINSQKITPRSIFPAPRPNAIIPLSRRGYTARRCGEAEPAPGAEEGRELPHQGSAENGPPPGTAASARM